MKKYLPWLLGAAAVLYVVKYFSGAVKQGAENVATAAQKALQLVTSDGPVKVNASIILPGAQSIPASSVSLTFRKGENFASFAYAGQRYQVMPRNSDGDYPAKVL